jgi:hypothetical protein
MIFVKGDRVKLTEAAIRSKTRRRHYYVDWEHRQGTVAAATGRRVRIIWDGRISSEMYVPKAVERVHNEPEHLFIRRLRKK